MDNSILPDFVKDQIREYFQSSCDEAGCLVTADWKVVPFENCASAGSRAALIEQRRDVDVMMMARLIEEGNLFAWAHSHPRFPCQPSGTDICRHNVPCNMVIWSGLDDTFGVWSPGEILAMRAERETALDRWESLSTAGEGLDGPSGRYSCYRTNDPSIEFDLFAESTDDALQEALDRLGWRVYNLTETEDTENGDETHAAGPAEPA